MSKWLAVFVFPDQKRRSCVARRGAMLSDAGYAVRHLGLKTLSTLVAGLLLAAAGLLVLISPASADLPNAPDTSAQANGRVAAILRVGDTIYVGGSFTQLRNPDGSAVARNYLGAIDANTGRVTGWNPNANNSVRAFALSPDGSRLYVGGTFTNIGGLSRQRLAAVNPATGAVDSRFSAGANNTVWALAANNNGVFAGGNFTTVKSQPRNRLAKVDGVTGALDPNWAPSADQTSPNYGSVRAMGFNESGSRLYVGGYFQSINGQPTGNLVALDPVSGAVDGGFQPNDYNGILSLAVSNGQVFTGTGDPLEGIEAFDAVTGQTNWRLGHGAHTPEEGDIQAITVENGTVYAGGHFDKIAEYTRNRLVAVDAATGTVDPKWTPYVGGGNLGVWAIDAQGPRVYAGGDFTRVAGRPQERFAQFTDGPDRPDMGLTGEYFDNIDFTGSKVTRIDGTVNYNWNGFGPNGIDPDDWSARWTGQVKPQYSETYNFHTTSDDGIRLWINGQLVIDNWTDHAPTEDTGQIALTAGQRYDVKMEFYERGGGAVAKLAWSSARQTKQVVPQGRLYPATVSP